MRVKGLKEKRERESYLVPGSNIFGEMILLGGGSLSLSLVVSNTAYNAAPLYIVYIIIKKRAWDTLQKNIMKCFFRTALARIYKGVKCWFLYFVSKEYTPLLFMMVSQYMRFTSLFTSSPHFTDQRLYTSSRLITTTQFIFIYYNVSIQKCLFFQKLLLLLFFARQKSREY